MTTGNVRAVDELEMQRQGADAAECVAPEARRLAPSQGVAGIRFRAEVLTGVAPQAALLDHEGCAVGKGRGRRLCLVWHATPENRKPLSRVCGASSLVPRAGPRRITLSVSGWRWRSAGGMGRERTVSQLVAADAHLRVAREQVVAAS